MTRTKNSKKKNLMKTKKKKIQNGGQEKLNYQPPENYQRERSKPVNPLEKPFRQRIKQVHPSKKPSIYQKTQMKNRRGLFTEIPFGTKGVAVVQYPIKNKTPVGRGVYTNYSYGNLLVN